MVIWSSFVGVKNDITPRLNNIATGLGHGRRFIRIGNLPALARDILNVWSGREEVACKLWLSFSCVFRLLERSYSSFACSALHRRCALLHSSLLITPNGSVVAVQLTSKTRRFYKAYTLLQEFSRWVMSTGLGTGRFSGSWCVASSALSLLRCSTNFFFWFSSRKGGLPGCAMQPLPHDPCSREANSCPAPQNPIAFSWRTEED